MTKGLPFTAASLARAIRGAEQAGKRVAAIRPDGTLVLTNAPPALAPADMATQSGHAAPEPTDIWGDVEA